MGVLPAFMSRSCSGPNSRRRLASTPLGCSEAAAAVTVVVAASATSLALTIDVCGV